MEAQKLKIGLTPIAGAIAAALAPSHQVLAQDAEFALEEIIVTATKRNLSVQDIPASVQAIGQEALANMGAATAEDFARFMPGINIVSYGSTGSTIVFRGAITGSGYIAASTSSVYLDELALTSTGSQPTLRMVDIARVEALAGPQGTLYGSDAQAGTLRIITNKPKMNEFEAVFDGELEGGGDSDASYRGSLVFNVPIIEDKMALRIAAYSDTEGGYIDNVMGYTADKNALTGVKYTQKHGTLSNAHAVESNWNDSATNGYRAKLRFDMNDSWSATLTGMMQHVSTTGGGNSYNPYVGDLKTVKFVDGWYKQNFKAYDLLIEGDLGFADLVSSTNYYKYRDRGVSDITDYAHYWSHNYCSDSAYDAATYSAGMPYYYTNASTGYLALYPRYCQGAEIDSDFYSTSQGTYGVKKVSQEIRLQSQGDRVDWIVGMYIEDTVDEWTAPFAVPTDGINDASTFQSSFSAKYYAFVQGDNFPKQATSSWYSDQRTLWDQKALFGEVAWRMTDKATLTLGLRSYDRGNSSAYYVDHPGAIHSQADYIKGFPADSDKAYRLANNGLPPARAGQDKVTIPKISLKYDLNEDTMAYALFTRGKRPGGVNRSRGNPYFPNAYSPDIMDNTEAGIRSTFGEGRGRFNLTAYYMKWDQYQLEQVDPSNTPCDANGAVAKITGLAADSSVKTAGVCGQPWQNLVANTGQAHISGVNIDVEYALTQNLTFGINYERMEALTDSNHDLNGTPDSFEVKANMRLPLVPENKGSLWATWSKESSVLGSTYKYVRFQASTQGGIINKLEQDSLNSDANPQHSVPGYAIMDIRTGLQGEDWEIAAYINNLTDERANYTWGTGDFGWAQASSKTGGRAHTVDAYTNRPREFGIRYMKRWGE
jgi:outer membrane receptor protein involved in Fe transport